MLAQVALNLLGQVLEIIAAGATAAGAGHHRRREGAQARRLQNLLGDPHFLGAATTRLRRQRNADGVADALLQQHRQRGGGGDDTLAAHARFGQPQMERIVAARRQLAIDRDQILHAAHLHRQDNAVVAESDLLGPVRAAQGRQNHGFMHHLGGVSRHRPPGVVIHQARRQLLVEAAPVDADPYRLVVAASEFDDGGELLVLLLAAPDIAGIDAVFVEQFGAGGMVRQQPVAVEMKIADQRHADPLRRQALANPRHGGGGLFGVDGHAHQLRTGAGQFRDLGDGGRHIGGVGVGHRLHHHRCIAAYRDGADVGRNAGAAREKRRRTGHKSTYTGCCGKSLVETGQDS